MGNLEFDICNIFYNCNEGYFGHKGTGKDIRVIECDNVYDTCKNFYDKIAYGGMENISFTRDGKHYMYQAKMRDGSIVTYREFTSTEDSPAVSISIKGSTDTGGIKKQKIHFVKRRK